eukprot:203618-Pyramimonas_sp.AAC.1
MPGLLETTESFRGATVNMHIHDMGPHIIHETLTGVLDALVYAFPKLVDLFRDRLHLNFAMGKLQVTGNPRDPLRQSLAVLGQYGNASGEVIAHSGTDYS